MTAAPQELREKLKLQLGIPHVNAAHAVDLQIRTDAEGHVVEDIRLNIEGAYVPATLIRPNSPKRVPCVLYCHARSDPALGRRELLNGSPYLQDPPYGLALARMGFAALCMDMPGFGGRRAHKAKPLTTNAPHNDEPNQFSIMLQELTSALGYLQTRGDIREQSIFTLGLSMGGALAFWLAAMEQSIAGVAHLCILADRAPLLASGRDDLFGPELKHAFLPEDCETGDIAGLAAPTPQLVSLGAQDPLTPQDARNAALNRLTAAYQTCPEKLETLIDPVAGHEETASMRVAVLDFLARHSANPVPFAGQQDRFTA